MGGEPIDPVGRPLPGGMGADEKTADAFRVIAARSPNEAIDLAIEDGLVSVARAISKAVNLEDESAFSALERTFAARSILGVHLASAIDSIDGELTASLAGLLLFSCVRDWHNFGAKEVLTLADRLAELHTDGKGDHGVVVLAAARALRAMAELAVGSSKSRQSGWRDACLRLSDLAVIMQRLGKPDEASACGLSSVNFVVGRPDDAVLRALDLALEIVRENADSDVIHAVQTRYATALASAATANAGIGPAAFDAILSVLRHLSAEPSKRAPTLNAIGRSLQNAEWGKPLLGLTLHAMVAGKKSKVTPMQRALTLLTQPIWELAQSELTEVATAVGRLASDLENARRDLAPQTSAASVEAAWSSFSLARSSISRTVEYGTDMLERRTLQEFALILNHEITHVLSMLGSVGSAVLALRTALVHLELALWTFVVEESPDAMATGVRLTPAPLEKGEVLALAQAEQQLEIALKLQMLQETWSCWFEGIAVFGELAADPTMDATVSSPVAEVMANLVDTPLDQLASEQGLSLGEAHQVSLRQSEGRYSQSLRELGHYRLRTYLEQYREKYLAGYLVARSIVAGWRAASPAGLNGAQAFRLLLHLTRYGTTDAIPDLALSLPLFHQEAQRKLIEWLEWISAAQPETLRQFFASDQDGSGRGWTWRDRQLVPLAPEDAGKAWTEKVETWVHAALASLVGSRSSPDRVKDADEECLVTMKVAAEALTLSGYPAVLKYGYPDSMIASVAVLPVGDVEAQFWMNRPTSSIVCLVVDDQTSLQGQTPQYKLSITNLDSDQWSALEREVTHRQFGRIRLTRMADLANPERQKEVRGYGFNYLVLAYGNWLHAAPRGLLSGSTETASSLIETIRDRLSSRSGLTVESDLTDQGRASARRTQQWIDGTSEWIAGPYRYQIEPWVQRVRGLTVDALAEAPPDGTVAEAMLRLCFGTGKLTDEVCAHGLATIGRLDATWMGELMRTLQATAVEPAPSTWLDEHNGEIARELGPLFARTEQGWDIAGPLTKGE